MNKGTKIIGGILVILCLIGWTRSNMTAENIQIQVDLPESKVLYDTILASGNINHLEKVQLSPEITGMVKRIYVREGDYVEAGDHLISLDEANYRAEVERAKASLLMQEIEIERLQEVQRELDSRESRVKAVWQKGFADKSSYERLLSEAKLARIQVESAQIGLQRNIAVLQQAEDQLRKTHFKAPISGLVVSIDVKPGETVIAGTTNITGSTLLTIVDPNSIAASLRIDEADIGNIYLGQRAEIFSAAAPTVALAGQVVNIGKYAKRHGNKGLYFDVKVAFDNDKELFAGISCRAELAVARAEPALTLPISAINEGVDTRYVWKLNNGRAVRANITTGLANDTRQVVLSGVNPGDQIVIGPSRQMARLVDGSRIVAVEQAL